VLFTGNLYVCCEIEPGLLLDATTAAADEYFSMDMGWFAYSINHVIYYLGSSSVSNVDIDGETNFVLALAQCDTYEKRMRMIWGAGRPMWTGKTSVSYTQGIGLNDPSPVVLAATMSQMYGSLTSGDALFQTYDTHDNGTGSVQVDKRLLMAQCPIRLPFSSMCALDRRLFFDTRLLTQPIQITLTMRRPKYMASAALGAAVRSSWGTAYKSLTLQADQFELSDKSLSLREELLAGTCI